MTAAHTILDRAADRPFLAIRRAVRETLRRAIAAPGEAPLVLVALSGGADSLALAAALAAEGPRLGIRAGALVIDHGLQPGSAEVARTAAAQATAWHLDPVLVRRIAVPDDAPGGPEAAARTARYAAFAAAAAESGARAVLTGHTRSDQAEQVLLGLARGSGLRSIAGIPPHRELGPGCVLLRPFLAPDPEITRATTAASCARLGVTPWSDPHNADPRYARVRVRDRVLPVIEGELGPGVAAALARTADLAAEDADALDALAAEALHRARREADAGGVALDAETLRVLPAALRNRVIRQLAATEFGAQLSREHTATIAALVTDWRGQGPIPAPGIRVRRAAGRLQFQAQVRGPAA